MENQKVFTLAYDFFYKRYHATVMRIKGGKARTRFYRFDFRSCTASRVRRMVKGRRCSTRSGREGKPVQVFVFNRGDE